MLWGERSGLAQRVFWIDRHVFNLDSVPLQGNSTGNGAATGAYWMALHKRPKFRREAESCRRAILFPLATVNKSHFSFAEPCGRFDESVEHRLQIKRRAADDLQHIGGSGL